LADIFLGKVTRWNDPALAALNPGVALPSAEIINVHRSDGSGTTFNFTDYLSNVSQEWKTRVGASTTVNWPGGLGGRGNEGVAGEVRQNQNAIGYVELAYAVQNRLGIGLVQNKAGAWPAPSFTSVSAAAGGALETMPDDFRVSIVNADGQESWPISTFTWLLVYRQQRDAAKGRALADFMFWSLTEGQKFAANLYYAPLPSQLLPLVYAKLQSMNTGGVPNLSPDKDLPRQELPRTEVSTVDNGDGTATTFYSDGTSATWRIGG
jgi:phosphate transport system substrate-binding protein